MKNKNKPISQNVKKKNHQTKRITFVNYTGNETIPEK